MTSRREEILAATAAAARIRDGLAEPDDHRTSFDVIRAVNHLDIPLMFRPLKGLWGAAITVDSEHRGMLVTTKMPYHIQRFTIAHELGHIVLGHEVSFDEQVGFLGRYGPSSRPLQELAADTFASELLAPKSLMLRAAKKHGWKRETLRNASAVYQLSLRLGISFEATCWALVGNGVVQRSVAQDLTDQKVMDLKLRLTSREHITDSWASVWELSENDADTQIHGAPEDLFVFRLHDIASSGYLWEAVDLGRHGEVVDEKTHVDEYSYGPPADRSVAVRFATPGIHQILFEHRRPWNSQRIAKIDIAIDNYGKEEGGLPRSVREESLVSASS